MSDPEGALSAGIIVQDFQIQSTNDKWEATFVSRDDKKGAAAAGGAKGGAIYKKVRERERGRLMLLLYLLAFVLTTMHLLLQTPNPEHTRPQITMRGFAVYWNTRSVIELGGLSLEQLLKEMARYEEITAAGGKEKLTYIVSPVTLEVKVTHNEGSADPATPVYVVVAVAGGEKLGSAGVCVWADGEGRGKGSRSFCSKFLTLPTLPSRSDGPCTRAGSRRTWSCPCCRWPCRRSSTRRPWRCVSFTHVVMSY